MKKLYLILLSVFALLNTAVAQKLSVESFVLAPTDITAQTEGRKDLNGDACALVKIFVVGDVADVEGNVVKPLVKKNSQTWAFMTQGSKQMQVIAQVVRNYLKKENRNLSLLSDYAKRLRVFNTLKQYLEIAME